MGRHFVERCRVCRVVVRQCRCPGPREELPVTCKGCNAPPTAPEQRDPAVEAKEAIVREVVDGRLRFRREDVEDIVRRAVEATLELAAERHRAQLRKYGCHLPECRAGVTRVEANCTCGLVEAARARGESK